MNKKLKMLAGAAAIGIGILALVGWNVLPNDDTSIPGPAYFGKTVSINNGSFYLGGTQVTANADNLNSGVASSTASLVSNATLKVYGNDLTILANGNLTLGTNITVSGNYPAANGAAITALAAGNIAAGNIAVARMTNALYGTGTLLTNTCIAADGKTNTYVFTPMGGVYVLRSITTSAP